MTLWKITTALASAALFAAGCTFTEEALWPSLTGEEPSGGSAQEAAAPAPAALPAPARPPVQQAQRPASVPRAAPQAAPPPTGGETGTSVGKKIGDLGVELDRLRGSISQHNSMLQELRSTVVQDSQRYHGTVAAINARLQVGTTPGNPVLVQQFTAAQSELDRVATSIGGLNRLAAAVDADSTLSAFLSESTHAAFTLTGAVDEDHRRLAILEDEVNRTVVLVDRLMNEVADDVRRQTQYVATERSNLNLLSTGIKVGEIYGASLVNRAVTAAGASAPTGPLLASADISGRRPLVLIRFDRPDVPFQQALYNAVSRALERRPNASFDLLAVAPAVGTRGQVALNTTKARQEAGGVLRALIEMGLPPSRVAMSASISAAATTNEVHLYIR
ncbi:MAG: hypothetical protein QGG17_06355 [Rhodospirillales bacterium]|nr:hypothetical protein [Rhodospirillales bacterium]